MTKMEKPSILKLNKILFISLIIVVVISMTTYMGVVSKESKIKELHAITNKVNFENIELKNKVDYMKSFYALDHKVQKMDFLKKPDQIMEVKSSGKAPVIRQKRNIINIPSVPGF